MKRMKWLGLLLALALLLLAGATAAWAEEEAVPAEGEVLSAPVDDAVEEIETEIWTEEIAKDVEAAEAAAEAAAKDGEVAIDAAHFPDEAFRDYIKENFDDGDGVLSQDELAAVKQIVCYNKGIASLEGVKLFPNLNYLSCSRNTMTSLDLSGCTALQALYCQEGELTSLNLSGCTGLTSCTCYKNQLATINLTGCAALVELTCDRNSLTSLDVSDCLALEKLNCGDNQLTSLNVRMCTALTDLTCGGSPMTTLDVRGCTALKWLICTNAQLTSLNASGCVNLTKLEVTTNRLTSLDLSEFDKLFHLYCAGNQLTTLDVRNKADLKLMDCHANPLTELDLSGCSNWMINCAAAKPEKIYEEGTDHEYFKHTYGTGELLIIDRDVKTVFDGNVIYDPPLISKCTITGIEDQVYIPYGTYPDEVIMDGDRKLVYWTDYKSRYENAQSVGMATLTLWGIGDYTGTAEFTYRILQCPIKDTTIEDIPDQAWTGSAVEPVIKVTHKGTNTTRTLRLGEDYTVAYSDNVDPGTATVTLTGLGNYKGTATARFRIVRDEPPIDLISIADCKITGVKAQTYTGKAIKPEPTVKLNGVKLVKGTDYTVSYKNNRKVGTAKLTVKGIGSYTGSKSASFKINPKGTALSKLTAGKGKLTVQWKKGANITGYQLQYSLKKNFAAKKTATVAKAGTTKKVLKNLKSGKRYYVRIRTYKTVGGKKYYSAWSKAKYAKVK